MPDPTDERPTALSRNLARLGMLLAAFGVFTCGWLAMRTSDWRQMALYTVLAICSAMAGSAFSRRAR